MNTINKMNMFSSDLVSSSCGLHKVSGEIAKSNQSDYVSGGIVLSLSSEGRHLAALKMDSTGKNTYSVNDISAKAALSSSARKMISNLKKDTSLGLSSDQKEVMVMAAERMFREGYEAKFVAGVLGNIQNEGKPGQFESSAYKTNPNAEPDYLKYMDRKYDYRNKFSGKSISQVGISAAIELQNKVEKEGFKGKFGFGMIQWTGSRTTGVLNAYKKYCKSDKPSASECAKAEVNYLVDELKGEFANVYKEWKEGKKTANSAGEIICNLYEKPKDSAQAKLRAHNASRIYNVMAK